VVETVTAANGRNLLTRIAPGTADARLQAVTGIWKDRAEEKSTVEIMKDLRSDD